jgi:hypothetical protein
MDTRRFIIGLCFFLVSSLISWRTKKQSTLSNSYSEAEYKPLSNAVCEIQWLTYSMNDFKLKPTKVLVLYCDNQSALHIVANSWENKTSWNKFPLCTWQNSRCNYEASFCFKCKNTQQTFSINLFILNHPLLYYSNLTL